MSTVGNQNNINEIYCILNYTGNLKIVEFLDIAKI